MPRLLLSLQRRASTIYSVLGLTLLFVTMAAGRAQAQEVIEYYGTDALGSIRVVFDASGNVISRADYLPFGEELVTAGSMPPERFIGQARDGEAGMDYFHARQYQPRTGRFNAVDPIYAGLFDPQQWNRYAYARNNPLSFVDPTGLLAEGPRNFCGAEFDFRKCGGEDLFWDTGGGGGGFEFGGDYARSLDQGYVPGMPSDIWAGLQSFNQGVDDAVLAAFYRDAPTETIVGTSASLPRALQLAGQAITRLTPVAQRALDGLLRLMNRSKEFEAARQALLNAQPTGNALKEDLYHRAAVFKQAAANGGSYFATVGGDGKPYTLIQYLGKLNNTAGRYEYMIDAAGNLTHQLFVAGGSINGIPIKP